MMSRVKLKCPRGLREANPMVDMMPDDGTESCMMGLRVLKPSNAMSATTRISLAILWEPIVA